VSATALPATGGPADGWAPCSDRSRERDDPLTATGGFGARWLLVEIDGAWGMHAFFESRLEPGLGRLLVRRAEAAGIRPVAIRRFGRRADERRGQTLWRWALIDARPGLEAVRWGEVTDPAELLTLPLDGSAGIASDGPVLLVCTHARHDQCCAVRGRPVARTLARAFPEETWESSHLGGDRFAATMILLPHGLYYGRVPAADAVTVVDRYLRGEIVEELFRGRSALSHPVQAAQSYARRRFGDVRIEAYAPVREGRRDDGTWSVDLAADGGIVRVALKEIRSAPLLSTCGATRPASVREFELVSIETHGPQSSD
jgi:(2Fe-2S) ferredoxin